MIMYLCRHRNLTLLPLLPLVNFQFISIRHTVSQSFSSMLNNSQVKSKEKVDKFDLDIKRWL
jgi:hypothetical protein